MKVLMRHPQPEVLAFVEPFLGPDARDVKIVSGIQETAHWLQGYKGSVDLVLIYVRPEEREQADQLLSGFKTDPRVVWLNDDMTVAEVRTAVG